MDYQGNSRKAKDDNVTNIKPEKQIEKVVTGEVVQKPKTIGRKFKEVFFGGDIKLAARYVAGDVLLPAFRNLIVDATSKGIERIVYGESSYRPRPSEFRSRTQYHNPFSHRGMRDPRERAYLPDQPYSRRSDRKEMSDIILASREEAEMVVERLIDIVDMYEVASLADLYELLGLPSNHTHNKWGWTFLKNTEVRQTRDGYLIDLPVLEEI